MADLIFHHGARFGLQFHYHFLVVPYVLLDLLVATAVEVLGARVAVAAWTVATFLSVPAALLVYFRATAGVDSKELFKNEATLFLVLCAAYLSTDFFFVAGFFAFKLGLASVIVILALIERLRRHWSTRSFLLYGAFLAAAYLIHLTTVVFIVAIVGASAVVRLALHSLNWRRELLLLAPIITILIWHFGVAVHYGPPTDLESAFHTWGTPQGKVAWLTRNYHRYGGRLDSLLLDLYVTSLLALVFTRNWREALQSPRVIELLTLAATFFALYLILPFSLGDATYVGIRALAPATLFILLACLHLPRADPSSNGSWTSPGLSLALAIVLSALNLAYLDKHFVELSRWSAKARTLLADIPRGAHVLPIETRPDLWRYIDPSAMAVIDRQDFVPYLFSANTYAPQVYFRYVDYPYAPPDTWYVRDATSRVDWRQIARSYRYLYVTRPFALRRIGIGTKLVAENSSAALLAIDPAAAITAPASGIARPQTRAPQRRRRPPTTPSPP